MPSKRSKIETCAICGTVSEVEDRAWFYTCVGCGSGINLIGIWWREQTGENWLELSQEEKRRAGERFFMRRLDEKYWSNVVIEL